MEEQQTLLEKPSSRLRCCWSIRSLLLIFPALVVSMVLFVGIFVWVLSYVFSRNSIRDMTNQVQQQLSSRIMARGSALLDIPPYSCNIISANVKMGINDVTNYTSQRELLWRYFQTFSQASFLSTSTNDDIYYSYERMVNGTIQFYRLDATTNNTRYVYACDNTTGLPIAGWGPVGSRLGYRPTTRDWYKDTIAAGKGIWSSIYLFSNGVTGLTRSNILSYPNGTVFGVVTTDFVLGELNLFMRTIKVSDNGRAFMVEKNGLLIATSSGPIDDGATLNRLPAVNSSDSVIARISKNLVAQYGTFGNIIPADRTSLSTSYFMDGQNMLLEISNFTYDPLLNWIIVVIVPELDFLSRVLQSTAITMSVSGVALFVSLVLALAISLALGAMIARPLEVVSKQMRRIANIDFTDKDKNALSSLYEFTQMEYALKQMKQGLSQFKKFVPREFLKAINCDQVSEVKLGLSLTREFSLLYIDIPEFYKYAKGLSSNELLSFVNKYIGQVSPIIQKKKGFIAKHFGVGFLIAFPDTKKALNAAKKIQQTLGYLQLPNVDKAVNACMAIHTGSVTAGTVGEEDTIDTALMSEVVAMTMLLYSVGKRYKCNIVTTKETLASKTLKKVAKTRLVGMYKIKNADNGMVEVLEVVDSDSYKVNSTETYNKASSIIFGGKGNYQDAISALQSIAKQNPHDALAASHLALCKQLNDRSMLKHLNLSVQDALNDPVMFESLEKFCNQELNAEAINLWKLMRQTIDAPVSERKQLTEKMFKEFIDKNAASAVNIRDETRNKIQQAIAPNSSTALDKEFFHPLIVEIQILLMDPFKRWKTTDSSYQSFFASACRTAPSLPVVELDLGMTFNVVEGTLGFDNTQVEYDQQSTAQLASMQKKKSFII
jgi:class 3 adenylate cyclase